MNAANETRAAGLKLAAFTLFSILVVVTVAATIRPMGGGAERREYTAILTSASRLQPGDEIRVAGVVVGRVNDVRLTKEAQASVKFSVDRGIALSTATRVEARYLNLVGDRYVALIDDGSSSTPQPVGQSIGTDRTRPALDLNDLLNGFKPLFAALSQEDVNALSLDIVQTLQGDGATVQSLIAHTASLTSGLAERDQLIGDVVTNLDSAVGSIADRQEQVTALVTQLRSFVGGLSEDRKTIGRAISHIDAMAQVSADLLAEARPSIKADLGHLRAIAATLNEPENTALVEHALDHLPSKLDKLSRTASYGSWFNYYLCSLTVKVGTKTGLDPVLADSLSRIKLVDTSARCQG